MACGHFKKWPKNQGIILALSPPITLGFLIFFPSFINFETFVSVCISAPPHELLVTHHNYNLFDFNQEFLQIEAEQRRKKEEEERQVEERRSAARKLQTQHEEIQQQRQAEVRRKMESKNATPDQK